MKAMQVGMLVPWVNTAMEEEIPTLLHPNIGLHWSRLLPSHLPKDGHDTSYLELLLLDIPNALSRLEGLDLNVIVLGCTSVSFVDRSIPPITPSFSKLTFLSAFDTVVTQLKKHRCSRIMLITPYEEDIIKNEVAALANVGIKVTKSVRLEFDREIRFIKPTQICSRFYSEYSGDCDAVFISCTALYTLEAIDSLKRNSVLNIPIISSNTAIADTLNDLCHSV